MLSAKYRQLVVVILKISKYGPTSHFLTATAPTPQSEPASSSSSVISSLLTPHLKQTRGNDDVLQYGVTTSHHPHPHPQYYYQ